MRVSADRPLFRKLDNLLLRVANLDAAISFYRDRLGHRVLWRSDEAVGFALPETDAELVAHLNVGPETDVLVEDVDKAFAAFVSAGGEAVEDPFDIAIGRCARVRDPFGNELVLPGSVERRAGDRRRWSRRRHQAEKRRCGPLRQREQSRLDANARGAGYWLRAPRGAKKIGISFAIIRKHVLSLVLPDGRKAPAGGPPRAGEAEPFDFRLSH